MALKSQSPYLITELITRTLDVKGDVPADITAEVAPVIVLANLSDHQYLFNRRGLSWGVSAVTPTVAAHATFMFTPKIQGQSEARKIIRITSLQAWVFGAGVGPSMAAYKLWNSGVQPVLSNAFAVQPGCRDARMGVATASLMEVIAGTVPAGPADTDNGWMRFPASTMPGNENFGGFNRFDPQITMRPADAFQVVLTRSSMPMGFNIEWEERDVSPVEYQGNE